MRCATIANKHHYTDIILTHTDLLSFRGAALSSHNPQSLIMSKQNKDDEVAVPVPTSFEVNNDEQWAADHTELGQVMGTVDQFESPRSDFVSYATSDESDLELLNKDYPGFVAGETAVKAVADLPITTAEEFPANNINELVCSIEDDEEEMMFVVDEISDEIINVMAEETLERTVATAKSFSNKIGIMQNDATAFIFPHQETSVTNDEETPEKPSCESVAESTKSAGSEFSKKIFEKMIRKYNMNDDFVAYSGSGQEESRDPYDDDGVWSPILLACGGLRECFDTADERARDSVYPPEDDGYNATEKEQEAAANKAATMAMDDIFNETKSEKKKRFNLKFKSGKVKNLFRRRRNAQTCELLA